MKNFSGVHVEDNIIKPEQASESDVWAYPTVEEDIDQTTLPTNALGKKPSWRYEPPEEVEEEITPLTAEDIEEIRQAAYQEGFNQGKEEGFSTGFEEGQKAGHEEGLKKGHIEGIDKGLTEGKETVDTLANNWQTLIEQLHQPIKSVEKNVEQQLLQLVVQLTEAVTYQEAKTNHDILFEAIDKGMKALPSQEAQTQILLNPDDIMLVEQQFTPEYISEQGWRLLPSPKLPKGSCQIENSTSNIDLSIKTRLTDVLESFLQNALHQ
ncbi:MULTISPECIES: flagellar assembly protein FliH [Thalassotalea]|uniref:flagellar assembly protein FliH n=1 Tax=Thalassotalea TaxID=1518149 RepID=UPI00094251D7|nr:MULTISPECIES: flagellar assembly protein FliH [Thalassotalea]OKY24688.1 flagellar assembly protein FliH [Thalassotalea sp. PP2-459]